MEKEPDIPLVESSFKKAPKEPQGNQDGLPFLKISLHATLGHYRQVFKSC